MLLDAYREAGFTPVFCCNDEWHGPCPLCGGVDRFFIRTERKNKDGSVGWCYCRHCEEISGNEEWFRFKVLGDKTRRSPLWKAVKYLKSKLPREIEFKEIAKPSLAWSERQAEYLAQLKPASQDLFWRNFLCSRGAGGDESRKYFSVDEAGNLCISYVMSGKVVAIKRRSREGFYFCVEGSFKDVWLLSAVLQRGGGSEVEEEALKRAYVVESEIDAIALSSVSTSPVIGTGGSTKVPSKEVANHLKRCKEIVLVHDNDEAGLKMLDKWRIWFQDRVIEKPTPFGKDVGEFVRRGGDMRELLLKC
jgi:hypothetical protein